MDSCYNCERSKVIGENQVCHTDSGFYPILNLKSYLGDQKALALALQNQGVGCSLFTQKNGKTNKPIIEKEPEKPKTKKRKAVVKQNSNTEYISTRGAAGWIFGCFCLGAFILILALSILGR